MTAAEFIKVRHPQDYDDIPQWHIDELEAYAAQQIADKMVEEKLRDELALYHRWIQKNKYTNIIHSHHECAAEYLKSRDSYDNIR